MKVYSILSIIALVSVLCIIQVSANVNVVATNQSQGVIRSDFYGVNTHGLWFSGNATATDNVDTNNDGTRDTITNFTWHRQKFNESGMNYIRIDLGLSNYYSNTTDSSGVNMTGNLTRTLADIDWACGNNIRVLFTFLEMPSWLADNSTGYAGNNLLTSIPSNYTKWGNILVDLANRTSREGLYLSCIDYGVFNEPNSVNNFLKGVPINNITRSLEYNNFYNNSYNSLKTQYPNLKFTGPAMSANPAFDTIMFGNWVSNFSNQVDKLTYHIYIYNGNVNAFNNNLTYINSLSGGWSNKIIEEYGVDNATMQVNDTNSYKSYFAQPFISMLNLNPSNFSLLSYQWSERFKYNNNANASIYYPEFPKKWSMLSEPQLDNEILVPYNITKSFANNHKANNTVYNLTITDSGIKAVYSTNGTNDFLTLINTNATAQTENLIGFNSSRYFKDYETNQAYDMDTPITLQSNDVKTMYSVDGSPININTTCENQNGNTSIIADHDISCNSTINLDSGNRLDTVQSNLSGTVTNIKDPSLILCYNFDNRSELGENDTYVVDWCGGNNGTVVGGSNISWISNGKHNGAFTMNGNNNLGINGTTLLPNTSINYSVSAWFKFSGSGRAIISQQNSTNGAYALQRGADGSLQLIVNGAGCYATSANYFENTLGTTNWYYITGTFDGSNHKVYIDGVLIGTCASSVYPSFSVNDKFMVGNRIAGDRAFNGSIDEVRVWNRTLSLNEIKIQYNYSLNKFNTTRYNIYSNQYLTNLTSIYELFINDTLQNNASSTQIIYRRQNLNLTNLLIGNIRDDSYGVNVQFPSRLSSAINDKTWLENAFINLKPKIMRLDGNLGNYYSNTTESSGVNMTEDITNLTNQITFARNNNVKVLLVASYMPTWLADNSSGKCGDLNYCPPINATKYGNIIVDLYNRIGCTYDLCSVEIWNEPYLDNFWMSGEDYDSINKALNYTAMYLIVQPIIKANNSNIKVGGPAGFRDASNLTKTFLTNVTADKRDFISIHPYGYTRVNQLEQLNDTRNLFSLCTTLSVECESNIILSEWNVGTSALQNLTHGFNEYAQSISQSYTSILNNYPANITLLLFNWNLNHKYNDTIAEYPNKWAMVSGPTYDGDYAPSYNVTKDYATYCPSGWSVYNTSNDYNAGIVQVYCTDGTNKGIIITEIENSQKNITINGLSANELLIDINSTNLLQANSSGSISGLVLDNYSVNPYTTPVFEDQLNGTWMIDNYLNETFRVATHNEVQLYAECQDGFFLSNVDDKCYPIGTLGAGSTTTEENITNSTNSTIIPAADKGVSNADLMIIGIILLSLILIPALSKGNK